MFHFAVLSPLIGTILQLAFHSLDTCEDYKPPILQNSPQFGLLYISSWLDSVLHSGVEGSLEGIKAESEKVRLGQREVMLNTFSHILS